MNSSDDGTAIQFHDVSYRINNTRELLHKLDLEVQSGETLVLLGRSGSGKTTTLKLINHLLIPSSGDISVNGHSPATGMSSNSAAASAMSFKISASFLTSLSPAISDWFRKSKTGLTLKFSRGQKNFCSS